jgi:RNA polymerase sigma-70 factor (ECF subfamily)
MGLVRGVLQRLPVRYRAAIVLREIEGLSYEELGAVLDVSPSTARVILFRAKERFRSLFNQLTTEETALNLRSVGEKLQRVKFEIPAAES